MGNSIEKRFFVLIVAIALIVCSAQAQRVVVRKRVPARGRTVVRVDNSVKVVHRGTTLHYAKGVFYRPTISGGYVVLAPPVGVRVATLPARYARLVVRGGVFFYYNGIFYESVGSEYAVVAAPIGARVTVLPQGYELRLVDGQKYYVVDSTFYREIVENNSILYEVVDGPQVEESTMMVGARLPRLPEDAEVNVIDDQKFYVSDGVYLKEVIEDNTIWYEVVGEN